MNLDDEIFPEPDEAADAVERCHHGVLFCDPCERCADEEECLDVDLDTAAREDCEELPDLLREEF